MLEEPQMCTQKKKQHLRNNIHLAHEMFYFQHTEIYINHCSDEVDVLNQYIFTTCNCFTVSCDCNGQCTDVIIRSHLFKIYTFMQINYTLSPIMSFCRHEMQQGIMKTTVVQEILSDSSDEWLLEN